MSLSRAAAAERVERLLEAVEVGPLPVPIREVWVYGDLALGLDPVERLDVYLTKDLLYGTDTEAAARFEESHGVKGVGKTVSAEWAEQYPDRIRVNHAGHAAPEKCLAAHLVDDDEPIHLEVCNTGFEDNVTQRLKGARLRDAYEQVLDPRGVCLWVDGTRSETAFEKLESGAFAFPTLAGALEMLGMDDEEASTAADAVREYRASEQGVTVRGDVV